jgi:hypothetical protein
MNRTDGLERGLLGALLLQPGLLEDSDLRDSDFSAGRFRETFSAISDLWEADRPATIDPLVLADRVGGNDPVAFIAALTDGQVQLKPDIFHRRVTEIRKRALTARILAKIEQQAKAGDLDLEAVRSDFERYDGLQESAFDFSKVLITGAQMQTIDLHVEWAMEKLIPARSLTLLHGPGGLGKTWIALAIAKAISVGAPFLGLQTIRRPVIYIDLENPWPMAIDRVRQMDVRDVNFWHLSAATRPPKLDDPNWMIYMRTPPGTALIFDSARSCFDGDENDSQDVALVMNRLKEIRERDHEILILHHTPRANERASKGSVTWEDLADHVLAFYKVHRATLEETEDDVEPDPNALLTLRTGRKTRYAPARLYLTMDTAAGTFDLAVDPNAEALDAIVEYINGPGAGKNQGEIIEWAKGAEVGPKKRPAFIALLNRGEHDRRYRTRKGLKNNAKYYERA